MIANSTDKGLSVKYSGHTVNMQHEFPELLVEIQARVEKFIGQQFNHILLNKYQSGDEYIGKHRDTKDNKVCGLWFPGIGIEIANKEIAHCIAEPGCPTYLHNAFFQTLCKDGNAAVDSWKWRSFDYGWSDSRKLESTL